jgi:ankyrin repeat protein
MTQRWVRPYANNPGQYKRQLANKYLAVGARGDVTELRHLLKAHPELLSKRGNHNRTLLWEAARRGRLAAVRWLVKQGAELDATGCYNSEGLVQLTPYCAAVYYRRAEVAAYLLAQGAALDIFRAAFLGDQARVAEWLASDPALLQAEDPHDQVYFVPPVAFAVAGGQAEMLANLFQWGATVAPYDAQLLHLATAAGRLDLLEMLRAQGARFDAADTSIFLFAPDLAQMRYLLHYGVSPTRKSMNGFLPHIYLARGDKTESPEKVRLLLEHGAAVNAAGPRGRTALHYAAAGGHTAVIQVLLEFGADARLADASGATPLALARAGGYTAAMRLLRSSGVKS